MFSEPDLARRLYICHNAVFFLHAGLTEARVGLKTPEKTVPGAEGEARDQWLQHLERSGLEDTLLGLVPKLLKLVLRAPTLDVPYPLLPVPGTGSEEQGTEPQEDI
jgi:hypothetical protein